MTILEKIVKVAKLEEAAENCTDQNCNSIMEILLRKANRDNNVAATLMNIYLECNDKVSFNKVLSAIIGMTFDEFLGFCIEDLEVEINTDGKDNIIGHFFNNPGSAPTSQIQYLGFRSIKSFPII